jgi:hypothetical protein
MRSKKERKPSRKKLKAEADRLFSLVIRTRDDWTCKACGSCFNIQAAHLLSRRYLGTRFMETNCCALCQKCHMKFTYDPLAWEAWCEERWPDRLRQLKIVARETCKKQDYAVLCMDLTDRLERLKQMRMAV